RVAERDHDAARLVAGDHRLGATRKARGGIARLEARAIDVQVAAAHAGRLDLEHDVARPRHRVGKITQRELAVTEKHAALHGESLSYVCSAALILRSPRRARLKGWRRTQSMPPWFETRSCRTAPHHEGCYTAL